jgi:hypothetical protein
LIVKCPNLGFVLVYINSDAFEKNFGGGMVLEIVTLSRSRLLASSLLRFLLWRKEFGRHGTN